MNAPYQRYHLTCVQSAGQSRRAPIPLQLLGQAARYNLNISVPNIVKNQQIMTTPNNSNWRIEDCRFEHLESVRRLFLAVFKSEMSEMHWHWKYGDGRGQGIVVLRDNELVAFFGGTERRVLFDGEHLVAMQCGDSMVAESYRGILTRKGPFYLSVTAFLGKYVGDGLPYLLSYGFPNARAMSLAQRLELYDDVGAMLEIEWTAQTNSGYEALAFDFASPDHGQVAGDLWESMAGDFADRAIGVRDLTYLKHRYLDNPTLKYDFHMVRPTGNEETLGLLVSRKTDDGLLLVDAVCRKQHLKHLIEFGKNRAAELACGKFYGWLTKIDLPLIIDTDPIAGAEPLRLPLGVYSPGLAAEDVRDKWFFLCGDSDFL